MRAPVPLAVMAAVALGVGPSAALQSQRTTTDSEQAQTAFEEGLRHQQAGRYQQAIEASGRSLKHDPHQAEALNNLGFCYKSLKPYHKAIGYYKDALAIDPNLAEAYEYLGEAYLGLGKVAQARREYQILLTLDPEEAEELQGQIDPSTRAPASLDVARDRLAVGASLGMSPVTRRGVVLSDPASFALRSKAAGESKGDDSGAPGLPGGLHARVGAIPSAEPVARARSC